MEIIGPLHDAFLRIDRAGEHLEDVKRRIEAYLDAHPDAFIARVEGMHVYPPRFPGEPPSRYVGVVIGETVQNLRTALDYLVFALAWFDSGEDVERKTQFPICGSPKTFEARRKTWLEGVSEPHIAAIKALQPFDGPNWLSVLRDLSNLDKHNVLAVAAGVGGQAMLAVGLSDEEAIALGGFRRPGDDVSMYYKLPAVVTFENGPPVVEVLQLLKTETRSLLEAFEPEFKGWEDKARKPSFSAAFQVAGPFGDTAHDEPAQTTEE